MNMLLTSLSFYFPFLSKQSTAMWPLFPQLLHPPLNQGFLEVLLTFMLSFSFFFPQQSDALWPYLPHLLHLPFKKLFFFFRFFSLAFNARTFYSDSAFYCAFISFRSIFQNQLIYFFEYLNSIFSILMLKDTLTGLYYSDKTSKTCALIACHHR